MKESRLDDWQQFVHFQKQRMNMKLSPLLQAIMDNCQYVLHAQFDKNTKSKLKHKKRKQELNEQYREAFKALSRDQKLSYYIRFMRIISAHLQGKDCTPPMAKGMFSSDVYSRSFNLKMWKHKKMRLDRQKQILYAQKDNKIKTYLLQDYLLRRSKNKQYHSFVLQATNDHPHDKSRTVHLGFKQQVKLNQWMRELQAVYCVIQWKLIMGQMKNKGVRSMTESLGPEGFGRSSEVGTERIRINSFSNEEDIMSKSVIINNNSKNQVVFVQGSETKNEKIDLQKKSQTKSMQMQTQKDEQFFSGEEDNTDENQRSNFKRKQTIIESLAKMDDMDQIEAITTRQEKKVITNEAKENIFARIMPEYRLQDIQNTVNYGSLYDQNGVRILGHLEQTLKIKMFISFPVQMSPKLILNGLTQQQSAKQTNPQIEQLQLKTLIKSQNSAMVYLKIKSYNKLYRPRDFIILRHAFSTHDTLYMIDKSIENVSYPPFTTIVRGEICILWAFKKEDNRTLLIADVNMNNQGYLNDAQNVNLVLKFLKGFANMQKVLMARKDKLDKFSLFNDKWSILDQYEESPQMSRRKSSVNTQKKISDKKIQQNGQPTFKKKKTQAQPQLQPQAQPAQKKLSNSSTDHHQIPSKQAQQKTLQLKQKLSHMQQQKGQIDIKQAQTIEQLKHMTVHGIKRQFDKNGHVIVSNGFVRNKYTLAPLPKGDVVFQEVVDGHPIWKGEWKHDQKVGGIIFINQKKIQDQKGVLKFILTKIGKNLLSGKSILNISLPVDIFCAQSNLQRLAYSLTYAPTHIQPAVKNKSPLQRLKKVIAFGISNSPLYLNMQKPFNPILGQTFQCWIDGCPVYAQQISHHPPIAALYYEGRGFKITAQLQSKVQLHMNSGCGTNDGVFKIMFEDGVEACYITPGGEVSGLTYGDRKFNMVGKAYYWIQSECLILELVFNPARKGFFSVGKQEQPTDYFEGYVCKVKPDFFESFNKKRKCPSQKQIVEKLGKVYGIWNKYVQYEQETILDIDKEYPAKLQYEAEPLPSDANWREDIAYRRILEITRAQSQKQRLQVLQRKDRKLREANPNHQKHKK